VNQANISFSFLFTQSYRRQGEQAPPNDFPKYTETGSIGKIDIEHSQEIRISRPLFMTYYFRSKLALENPVTMAFFLADGEIESLLDVPFQRQVDPKVGFYSIDCLPDDPVPSVISEQMQAGYPYRMAFVDIPEFSDFPDNLVPNYPEASFSKLIYDRTHTVKLANLYLVQSNTFASNEDVFIQNPNRLKYLYLICFLPKLQKTEVALAGRVNFLLEY